MVVNHCISSVLYTAPLTPVESGGLHQTPEKTLVSQECHKLDSTGLHWTPVNVDESTGVQWSLVESGGLIYELMSNIH